MVSKSLLDEFRSEINRELACGRLADIELVTSNDGGCPVVVALDSERLYVVLGRLRAVGGFANLFVRDENPSARGEVRVRRATFIGAECAIGEPDDDLSGDEAPGPNATVGMFLDYVASRPNGVMLSAAVGSACARDAREVDFASPTP